MGSIKAILFDIGGVCVASPFLAIRDYEASHNLPPGWINFGIARSGPTGAWARLERGEIPLDDAFYEAFAVDLCSASAWTAFHSRRQRVPASERATPSVNSDDLGSRTYDVSPDLPVPSIEARVLFEAMIATAAAPDPHMLPALRRLRALGTYVLGALSNTVPLPLGSPLAGVALSDPELRALFDVVVASHEVGVRKPERKAYELALERLDAWARKERDGEGIEAGEVLFLDDIGVNCKVAKDVGMRTIKVILQRAQEAVRDMERELGLDLGLQKGKL